MIKKCKWLYSGHIFLQTFVQKIFVALLSIFSTAKIFQPTVYVIRGGSSQERIQSGTDPVMFWLTQKSSVYSFPKGSLCLLTALSDCLVMTTVVFVAVVCLAVRWVQCSSFSIYYWRGNFLWPTQARQGNSSGSAPGHWHYDTKQMKNDWRKVWCRHELGRGLGFGSVFSKCTSCEERTLTRRDQGLTVGWLRRRDKFHSSCVDSI